ncbi:MAG TPA: acyl-ACP desaturase [Kofleriaceae bacterium]|nr:acyl-ACP desaturase [Kofleriaceae bacterium]
MLGKARITVEKGFRRSAMLAYALNQSRAKVVMDPIYLAVAKRLLRGTGGPSAKLSAAVFPSNLYVPYRAQSRRLQYFIEDWDFSAARPELLTARQRQMMHTVALGETSGAAVSDGFLRAFRTHPELAAFFGTWFTEELNHFVGYHMYLRQMGEPWPAARGLEVARTEVLPYADDPMEVAACNMYQELLGFLIYRSFSRQVKDPFLARMLAQFAKDECRHFRFYQDVVARHLQENPSFRAVVLKVFLKATSPYNQISGGPKNVIDHLTMGAFYFRKPEYEYFLRQNAYLFGTDLRSFWDWYFKGVVEACTFCGAETFQCACEHYEDGQPAPIKNPGWWKEVSRSPNADPRINIDAWAQALLAIRADPAAPRKAA